MNNNEELSERQTAVCQKIWRMVDKKILGNGSIMLYEDDTGRHRKRSFLKDFKEQNIE